jgi:tripartite-type tricarboxylate transporter receptor subunit TctC
MKLAINWFVPLFTGITLLVLGACAPAAAPNPTAAPAKPTESKPAATTAPAAKPAESKPAPTVAPAKPAEQPATKPAAQQPATKPTAKPAAPTQDVSFQGKTITILMPYTAGGSLDIMARQFLPFFEKHLPGNPTVIAQNMPGAGGILGENWFHNVAPKDGTFILLDCCLIDHTLLNRQETQYDLAKLQWLGAVSETRIAFVSSKLGVKDAKELMGVGKRLLVGDLSPDSTRLIQARLFLNLLGVDHKPVTGFGSSADSRAAMRRGEIDMTQDSLSGYYTGVVPMVQEGVVVPVAQQGAIIGGQRTRDPRLPELVTYNEALLSLKGESVKESPDYKALDLLYQWNGGFTRGFAYGPGVPENVALAVRDAVGRMLSDPALRDTYKKSVGFDLVSLTGDETQKVVEGVLSLVGNNPQALERIKQLATEGS